MTRVNTDAYPVGACARGSGLPVHGELGTLTLLEGAAFCISTIGGDVLRDRPHRLFIADTGKRSAGGYSIGYRDSV